MIELFYAKNYRWDEEQVQISTWIDSEIIEKTGKNYMQVYYKLLKLWTKYEKYV